MRHLQLIRGTAAAMDAYVGPEGELVVDSDVDELRLHDGVTPGGKRIPNVTTNALAGVSRWTALTSYAVAGDLPDSVIGEFVELTAAGAYVIPALSVATIGAPITLFATVGGITVPRKGADLISILGVDQTVINMVAGETVVIAKKSVARWHVISRF